MSTKTCCPLHHKEVQPRGWLCQACFEPPLLANSATHVQEVCGKARPVLQAVNKAAAAIIPPNVQHKSISTICNFHPLKFILTGTVTHVSYNYTVFGCGQSMTGCL